MAYLTSTWGGNDNATSTYGAYDIYCNGSFYPAANPTVTPTLSGSDYIVVNSPTLKYPVWILYVGAYVASSGGAMKGTIKIGGVTSASVTPPVNTSYANATIVWGSNGGDLVYSGASAVSQQVYWNNTTTWGGWAGRNTSTSYTTVFTGSSTPNKTGQMGSGVRYNLAPTAPGTPTVTPSTSVSGRITVSWTAPSSDGAEPVNAYSIYRSTSPTGTFSLVEKSTTSLSYIDDTAKSSGIAYYYKIGAHNLVTDKVGSTTSSTLSASSAAVYSPSVPNQPSISSISSSDINSGNISISYSASVPSGSPAIDFYRISRNGITIGSSASTTYTDTTGIPGTIYSYTVSAHNSIGYSSESSSFGQTAPGAPAAPTSITVEQVGADINVSCTDSANSYGKSITAYYVQYQEVDSNGDPISAWSVPQLMTNKAYTYQIDPATYIFRVYAANSIINNSVATRTYYPHNDLSYIANFKVTSEPALIVAGGKRFRGSTESNPGTFQPSMLVKRHDGITWTGVATAKRFNGTSWQDLA